MVAEPRFIDVSLSQGYTTINGLPLPGFLTLLGSGEPGHGIHLFTGDGVDTARYSTVFPDGRWSVNLMGTFGGSYSYYSEDTTSGLRSPTLDILIGTASGQVLQGPTLGESITGPDVIFGYPGITRSFGGQTTYTGGGNTIQAYSLAPDAQGRHATGAEVMVDGRGGGSTLVVPVALDGLLSHHTEAGTGVLDLVLETADARISLTGINTLRFDDATLTVRFDPLVDFLFYARSHADIAATDADARQHYDTFGWREGRDPNALFDTSAYLAFNRDVAAAGGNPLTHYDSFGWKEGRSPSAAFDTGLYLTFNPDVAAAGVDPLAHYLQYGIAEGRKVAPVVDGDLVQAGFDPTYYALANPDVAASGQDPLAHYQSFGWREGRDGDAFFDTAAYLAANPDVQAAGIDPLQHYMATGWREGRDPSTHFDTDAYLAANADVVAAGVNPLQHFLQYGIAEGRSAHGDLF